MIWRTDADCATDAEVNTSMLLRVVGNVDVEVIGAFFSARFGKFASAVDFGGEDTMGRVRCNEFRWMGVDCRLMLNL